jgi:hypothetical protein
MAITGTDAGMFAAAPGGATPCSSLNPTIHPGQSCTVALTFTPTAEGTRDAALVINSSDAAMPTTIVNLSGAGSNTGGMNGGGVCTGLHIRIPGKGSYANLQDAYNAAAEGDIIQALATDLYENFAANRNISVTVDGGYNCDYSSNPDKSVIRGMPHVTSGTVTMKNFRISAWSGQAAPYTISIIADPGGTISPSSAIVNYGDGLTFAINPDNAMNIIDVKVDGVSQGVISSYTFSNVTSGHTIEAIFGCPNLPARINRVSPIYFGTLQAAYDAAVDGDVIQAQAKALTGDLTANRNIAVTVDGGYNCDYNSKPDKTVMQGMPHVTSGTVTLKSFRISNQ